MAENKVAVLISENLYKKIKQRIEKRQSEFNTVEEYLEYVLSEIVREEETEWPLEKEKAKKRLEQLGYL